MNLKRYYELRSDFLQLEIGNNGKTAPIWVKQLENILYSDIHQKPLGCRISDTHIKVGDVHLETFFEAEVLFSHHYWNSLFSDWLCDQIKQIIPSGTEKIYVIGYETYIEPVLFQLKDNLMKRARIGMYYGIYEEPKFTQNAGYLKTKTNIRYDDDYKKYIDSESIVVYLCGISTTLNTFREMREKLHNECKIQVSKDYCFSLVQVLPDEDSAIENKIDDLLDFNRKPLSLNSGFLINDEKENSFSFSFGDEYAYSSKKGDNVLTRYLVGVKSKWHSSTNCNLCSAKSERAIIRTSETSVVPAQMIKAPWIESQSDNSLKKLDLFKRDNEGNFVFWDYLYYGHVDRMDHHYIYYVRNAHLIKDILNYKFRKDKLNYKFRDEKLNNEFREEYFKFLSICRKIRKDLFPKDKKKQYVDIIVFPSESGDEVFPNAINKFVFGNNAHTISVDPNKEFRSNFGTKHSNIVYFLEQAKDNSNINIRFHYVAKHLVGAETFSRIKSLVLSLMKNKGTVNRGEETAEGKNIEATVNSNENAKEKKENSIEKLTKATSDRIQVFSDVIVFLNRNSKSSKPMYIRDIEKYYSFIDINVPSIRRYGDACPMCKLALDVEKFEKCSMLSINSDTWKRKDMQYRVKSIEEAKELRKEQVKKRIEEFAFRLSDELAKRLKINHIKKITAEQKEELIVHVAEKLAENIAGKSNTEINCETVRRLAELIVSIHTDNIVRERAQKLIKDQVKELVDKEKTLVKKQENAINQRYFRRFYLENHLFRSTKNCHSEQEYNEQILKGLLDLYPEPNAEILISFVKVISSPYLYYQEYEKNAALKIVSSIAKQFISFNEQISIDVCSGEKIIVPAKKDEITTYLLLIVCLNCLSKIDSVFLLSTETIIGLCKTVAGFTIKDLHGKEAVNLLEFGDIEFNGTSIIDSTRKVAGFLSCIVNNCKRIVCGISGEARAQNFELSLDRELRLPSDSDESIKKLMRILFLENATVSKGLPAEAFSTDIIEKYQHSIVNEIRKIEELNSSTKLFFVYYLNNEKTQFAHSFIENGMKKYELHNIENCIEDCRHSGEKLKFYGRNCLVYLCSNVDSTSHMFLQISFDDNSQTPENLEIIRRCLAFSKAIIETVELDLANNSIQLAISNDEANSLMTSGKIVSHGSFAETYILSKTAAYLVKQWGSLSNNAIEKELFFVHACQIISSVMDRCIGFDSIKQYVEQYASSLVPLNRSDPHQNKLQDIFSNFCLSLVSSNEVPPDNIGKTNDEAEDKDEVLDANIEKRFLEQYLKNIVLKTKSKYWNKVSKSKTINNNFDVSFYYHYLEGNNKKEIIVTQENIECINKIIEHIYKVDSVPGFLNSASFERSFPSMFLIGILDILFRNIYSHSDINPNVKVHVYLYENSYEFVIINRIKVGDKTRTGRTKKFFDDLNKIEHPKGGHFNVIIGKSNNKIHVAKLFVAGGAK